MRQSAIPLVAATTIIAAVCVYFATRSKTSLDDGSQESNKKDSQKNSQESSIVDNQSNNKPILVSTKQVKDKTDKISVDKSSSDQVIDVPITSNNISKEETNGTTLQQTTDHISLTQLPKTNPIPTITTNDDDKKTKTVVEETKNNKKDEIIVPKVISSNMKPMLIAYGSQSGNSMSIAQDLYEKFSDKGIPCNLSDFNSWKKWTTKLEETEHAIFLMSTTGNGDVPDNADKFQRYLKKNSIPEGFLKNMKCCILGLGDTNYDKFCEAAKWLERRLKALGVTFVMKLACADEATGLEDVVEPWLEDVVKVMDDVIHKRVNNELDDSLIKKDDPVSNETSPTGPTLSLSSSPTPSSLSSSSLSSSSSTSSLSSTSDSKAASASARESVSLESQRAVKEATDATTGEFNFVNPLAALKVNKAPTSSTTPSSSSSSSSETVIPSSTPLYSFETSSSPLCSLLTKRGLIDFETCMGGKDVTNQMIEASLKTDPSQFHKVVGMGLYSIDFETPENQTSPPPSSLSTTTTPSTTASEVNETIEDSNNGFFTLKVDHARYLTHGGPMADRRVIHAQLSGGPKYQVGDAIGVRCENEEEDVLGVYEAIKEDSSQNQSSSSTRSLFSLDSIVKLKNARSGEPSSLPPGCDDITSTSTTYLSPPSSKTNNNKEEHRRHRNSVYGVLKYGLDLSSSPKPSFCAALARCCPNGSRNQGILLTLALKKKKKNEKMKTNNKSETNQIEEDISAFDKFVIGQELRVSELILYFFPTCTPISLSMLIALLPPLSTRYYSVSSSPLSPLLNHIHIDSKHHHLYQNENNHLKISKDLKGLEITANDERTTNEDKETNEEHVSSTSTSLLTSPMSIAFSVVHTQTDVNNKSISRYGLCTNWFEKQLLEKSLLHFDSEHYSLPTQPYEEENGGNNTKEGENDDGNNDLCVMKVEANLKPCSDFTLPKDPKAHVVMIGPGTGVAPFIGFIQQRQALRIHEKSTSSTSSTSSSSSPIVPPQSSAPATLPHNEGGGVIAAEENKGTESGEGKPAPAVMATALASAFAVKLKTKAEKTRKEKGNKKNNKKLQKKLSLKQPLAVPSQTQSVETQNNSAYGEMTLYFGCRTIEDWIYSTEMQSAVTDGTITNLRTAFSRAQAEKVYVQDLLRLDANKMLPLLLSPNAYFYVCGDGTHMSKGVHAALVDILTGKALKKGGGAGGGGNKKKLMTVEDAEKHLEEMKECGRYVLDIW